MPPKATQLLPLLFASRVRSSSSRGTLMIRRARDLNRLIGLCGAALSPPLAAPLTSDVSRSRRRWRMICQFLVRQPPPCDRRADLPEPLAIIVLSLIEPEGLFVQIPAQMRRINTDVGSLKGAFQEAPEILDVVGVDLSANKVDRVVNHFMRVGIGKTEIGFEGIGVEMQSRLDGGANLRGQCSAAYIGDVHGFNAAGSLVAGTLDDAENGLFAGAARPFDFPLADMPMHVLGEPTNERFVGFNLAAHLQERAGLHCQPDAVIHEPSRLLSDTERPVHLVATDPVLAIGDHPDCREPLPEIDWAILENRSDLGRELAARMLLFALPQSASRNEPHVGATARRAAYAIRPTQLDHCAKRNIRVGKIPDSFDEGLGLGERRGGFHRYQYDAALSLSQVYYYPNWRRIGRRAEERNIGQVIGEILIDALERVLG